VSERVPATQVAPAISARVQRRRRGFVRTYLTPKQAIPRPARVALGIGSFVVIFAVWQVASMVIYDPQHLFAPSPLRVWNAWVDAIQYRHFLDDIAWSAFRIITGFLLAAVLAVPLGLLMGSFEVVRAFFQPPVNFIRYMPASAFIPLLLLLVGIDEREKLAIIWIGVFFQLVLMVMDIAQRVPEEMLNVAYTLGSSRWKVFHKVFLPATFPEVLDALRITMGWAWTYLIVAEIVAAERGIGSFILISERFLRSDRIIAAIVTIGLLGLVTDYVLMAVHRVSFPYVEKVHA
jgi:NitT/TauT family transport system permease protein